MAELTPEAELETLRRVNAELVTKNDKRKQRIAELESSNAALEGKLTDASASIHRLTIDTPLRRMAEDLAGDANELFIEQLTRHYDVALADGKLSLVDKEKGKPVTDEGKPVAWERSALLNFLSKGDDARAKAFQRIMIYTKASGSGNSAEYSSRSFGSIGQPKMPQASTARFGLR